MQQTPRWHFVSSGVAQIILSALFAPGDGGTLLNHWIVIVVLVHVGCYLLHYSVADQGKTSALSRLTKPTKCFLFSLACVILITIAITTGTIREYFGLEG